MLDILSTELEKYFEKSWNFIDKAKESNSGILIHCVMGRSRSPAILISYLMYRKHFNSLFDTFNFVNEKRDINPNNSFMISLCNFEISHFNIPESTMKGFDILKAVARVENSNSKRLNKKKQGNERAQEFIKEFLTEDLMLKAADGEFSKKKKIECFLQNTVKLIQNEEKGLKEYHLDFVFLIKDVKKKAKEFYMEKINENKQ